VEGSSELNNNALRQRFTLETPHFTYDGTHQPIGTVDVGEVFEIETIDCWSGLYQYRAFTARNLDGVTGPIFIRGAMPGDVIAVTLHNVEVTTVGSVVVSHCSSPLPACWWGEEFECRSFPIEDGKIIVSESTQIPIHPVVGCIATAPEREVVLSIREGAFGGNVDCAEITTGATVFLPVGRVGALLYMGDCKAIMADGEITQPPEVGTLITASVKVLSKPDTMQWPRVETDDSLLTVVSGPSLTDACRGAFREMLYWLESDYKMNRQDAAILMAMVSRTGLCQISNTLHTAKCIMPRSWLN
jgi:amidase